MDGAGAAALAAVGDDWGAVTFASYQRQPMSPLERGWRAAIALLVLLIHGLLGYLLYQHWRTHSSTPRHDALLVEFIVRPAAVEVAPIFTIAEPARRASASTSVKANAAPLAQAPQAEEPTLAASELVLYSLDGGLRVPSDLLESIESEQAAQRGFDYQIPGLAEAGTFMDRPPVLSYESTRFDAYWVPTEDLLTELLSKAVEKTTKKIRIPIPGRPGSHIVCYVSMLAMGGGCGVVNNNFGYVVQLEDPNTLDEAEARQCDAWWEQITGASSQEQWRKTKKLYELHCRKPRLEAGSAASP